MRKKHFFTDDIDNEIRRVYRVSTGKNEVNRLAARLNKPRWLISKRAKEIGAYEPRIKEPVWSEAELGVLERNAHKCPAIIRKHLKRAGFIRSETGIILKRKRMRYIQNIDGQSAHSISECFGVDEKTVTRWIAEGLLKATRRGTARTELQGGDTYYIKSKAVKDFIINNIGIIDIRKVDKFWLIDILA